MQPRDLTRLRGVTEPRLHPDGTRVAFVVGEPDLEDDRYRARIWLWDGDEARPYTHGPTDAKPRWSPDGRRLAFLRKEADDDAKPQVAVMAADGGEATVVTDFPLGVEDLEWSPDSRRLAVVGVTWIDELADLDDDERARRPRRLTRASWRFDNQGWTHDRRRHLYLVEPDAGSEPVLLTPGDFNESTPRWHPDGDRIAFVSARHDERDVDPGTQPFVLAVDGDGAAGDPEPAAAIGAWEDVSYRPDGVLHLGGLEDRWGWPDVVAVWRVEDDGSLVNLTEKIDRDAYPFTPTIAPSGPRWIGDRFLTVVDDRGRTRVVSVGPDGDVDDVLGGDRCITGVAPREDGSAFAFTATDPIDPGELHWWEDGHERELTAVNAAFRDEVRLVEPTHFTYESEDGAEVDAWAYLPDGDDPVPLLFNVHGGPASQYGWYFFDEFQVYAAAGYGVVGTNPRGSAGRGSDWVRAVRGTWSREDTPDLRDLERAVDAALERFPRLEPDRVGVMGGSYGGFATAWLLGRPAGDRYASAIVERGLLSWVSFAGTSDIGPYFDRMYVQQQLPEGLEDLWRASPLSVADRVTTPTLVLHSESDFRTPIEQGEQYFVMLRRHGVEAEFVRFPDEGHELSRSGKPRHRIERFDVVLEWHGRHLDVPFEPSAEGDDDEN